MDCNECFENGDYGEMECIVHFDTHHDGTLKIYQCKKCKTIRSKYE
jgi:hypothetical protein